jgi:Zn-dependent protease
MTRKAWSLGMDVSPRLHRNPGAILARYTGLAMLKLLGYLFAAGKLGKVALTGGTMIISVFAYALVFGWWYAVGFVLLIFVHEMGHFLAARQRGLDVGAPTFIPFVGAWIEMKDLPHNVEVEAYVGLAGPLAGTAGALVCYFMARSYDSNLLLALSYAGFFINLFNLIPLSPFDGGRITAVLSPRVWLAGVPILIALFFWSPSPMLILIALLAAPHLMKAWKYDKNAPENAAYYSVSLGNKVAYGILYLVLAAYLAVMSHDVHEMLAAKYTVGLERN